ncbi:putative Porin_4 domain-containing protein [Alphaproteobacteria bacterium]
MRSVKTFLFSTILASMVVVASANAAAPAKGAKNTAKLPSNTVKNKEAAYAQDKPNTFSIAPDILAEDTVQQSTAKTKIEETPYKPEDGFVIKIGGEVNLQGGVISQDDFFKNQKAAAEALGFGSDNSKDFVSFMKANDDKNWGNKHGFASNNNIKFDIRKTDSSGIKYGGFVELNANTSAETASGSKKPANKAYLYVEGGFGRIEGGSYDGASKSMQISGADVGKATGGIDGNYGIWIPYKAVSTSFKDPVGDKPQPFVLDDGLFFLSDVYLPHAADAGKANKLTYYTPKINGFTFGLSYVPNSEVKGSTFVVGKRSEKEKGYQNVVEVGLKYENEATNGVKFAGSLTGEFGQAKDILVITESGKLGVDVKRNNLAAWAIGGEAEYKGLAVAASYGNWGKSGTPVNKTIGDKEIKMSDSSTYYWTLGGSYTYNKLGASVTYLNGKAYNVSSARALRYLAISQNDMKDGNKFDALSFGAEYNIMPGLTPYAEVTHFKLQSSCKDLKTNKGYVFLAGLKINF